MLSATSPVPFPQSTPHAAHKRERPHDSECEKPKPRVKGPFVDDDEYGGEDEQTPKGSPSKRQMLSRPDDDSVPQFAPGPADIEETHVADASNNVVEHTADDAAEVPAGAEPETTAVVPAQTHLDSLPLFSGSLFASLGPPKYNMTNCAGQVHGIKQREARATVTYDQIVAARSKTKEGRAKRSYYGIDIHTLMDNATKDIAEGRKPAEKSAHVQPVEAPTKTKGMKGKKSQLWTEKYRAKNFMDLCGDDGTNRNVLRWLKRWDPVVFPGAAKANPGIAKRPGAKQNVEEEKPHKKILLLTGPPGLGKTTLAHVCARQAGYEVLEVNASDDRSRDVVKSRIRTSLGTESVKSVGNRKEGDGTPKVARPVCVVVDEVDGVVTGSGASGEGGFVRALMDLVLVDQKNSSAITGSTYDNSRKKKKGDDFRLMRPLILICNDVYHPSLRPLRQSNLAEIVHVGRPSIDAVVGRLKAVFDKEGIPCEKDASRKLCEAAWGMTSGIDAKRGAESTVEGDLRGVMVVGEWVASRFRSTNRAANQRLTRQWIETNILHDLSSGAAGARGMGRGSVKDIVGRLFQEGGGFPKQAMDLSTSKTQHEQPKTELGFGEQQKKYSMDRLRQMVETNGEVSYIMNEILAEYPHREFNDDMYLSKPNQAYDWLHFHDACQSRLFTSQEWELAPYLSQPVLACHHLFASPKRFLNYTAGGYGRWGAATEEEDGPPMPFSGSRADYQANEAEKLNRSVLQAMQSQLSPSLMRSFRSAEDMAVDFLPYLGRVVSPDVKPVVVGGSNGTTASVRKESEKLMVKRATEVLADLGISLVKGRIEEGPQSSRGPQYVYRMEPDLDALCSFETGLMLPPSQAPTRYAVRQVLDQELTRTIALRESRARQSRFQAGGSADAAAPPSTAEARTLASLMPHPDDDKENRVGGGASKEKLVKRDFFGKVLEVRALEELDVKNAQKRAEKQRQVWVTFHEGLNNAVRKPISLGEFLKPL